MRNHSVVAVPTSFWIISILALAWNGLGLLAFISQQLMTPEVLSTLSEAEQHVISSTPQWVTIAFGTAVLFGALGSLALLFRKKLSIQFFLISMLAVFVQISHIFIIGSEIFQEKGWQMTIMPTAIVVVAIFLWRYAVRAHSKYWLS